MRYLLLTTLLLSLLTPCLAAEGLQVLVSPPPINVRRGVPIAQSVTFRNGLTPLPPIDLTASIDWVDALGEEQTDTATLTLNVVQPITVNAYRASLPPQLAFVAGSGTLDGLPIAPTITPGLATFGIGATLNEGQECVLSYRVRVL